MELPFLCIAPLPSRIAFSLSFSSAHPGWSHELASSASVSLLRSFAPFAIDSWNETMWQGKSQAANWHWLAQRQLAYGLTVMHYIRVRMQSKCTCIVLSRFERMPLETAERANRFSLSLSLSGWRLRWPFFSVLKLDSLSSIFLTKFSIFHLSKTAGIQSFDLYGE